MPDERNPQPQDELSEDQLADVSGGFLGGDPDRPVIVGVVPNDARNQNPEDQQQSIKDGLSNTIMLK
jgi:hypothetical protein